MGRADSDHVFSEKAKVTLKPVGVKRKLINAQYSKKINFVVNSTLFTLGIIK